MVLPGAAPNLLWHARSLRYRDCGGAHPAGLRATSASRSTLAFCRREMRSGPLRSMLRFGTRTSAAYLSLRSLSRRSRSCSPRRFGGALFFQAALFGGALILHADRITDRPLQQLAEAWDFAIP